MKVVSKRNAVYTFSGNNKPAEYVDPNEKILLELEDGFGGQVKNEKASLETLDWSRVNPTTGPIFINGVHPGDTLVANIHEIRHSGKGIIAVAPGEGAVRHRSFQATVKVVRISDGKVCFEDGAKLETRPMIGTVGVAPATGDVATGTSGVHGGNMDVKELGVGTRLHLPVFVEGALFAAGDMHAVQADGEVCVTAVEVAGEIVVSFDLVKREIVPWPVLETEQSYAYVVCGDSLDEASAIAVEVSVEALMREHGWSFEEAYMFASLVVDLRINQVVDPKKGIRAVIPKSLISIKSLYL